MTILFQTSRIVCRGRIVHSVQINNGGVVTIRVDSRLGEVCDRHSTCVATVVYRTFFNRSFADKTANAVTGRERWDVLMSAGMTVKKVYSDIRVLDDSTSGHDRIVRLTSSVDGSNC